ncbi:mRNA decay activator protein ZFP36L1 [Syngnathus acus]|uniref:mRNA decay activator protein ZFP36L1 n=1 Tax=Syngnathus acus TaxID=161584 RepID=UPI0018864CC1|nr:mRNA decay activator protein ZFP36L1 [Syngnathus acus]
MPSHSLAPFAEVEPHSCKNFTSPAATPRPPVGGFRRHHSLCPATLRNFDDSSARGPPWRRDGRLPRSPLTRLPFRADRSVSVTEGEVLPDEEVPPSARPPPGLWRSELNRGPASPRLPARYKTELCRTFEESGTCKYDAKCQFAHGADELRGLSRHPKYKTEPCRTFHTVGFCPYGARCHFVHRAEELAKPGLLHSLSFAGSPRPRSPRLSRAWSASPSGCPRLLWPLFPEPGLLRPCPYPLSAATEPAQEDADSALVFFALGECDDTDSVLGFLPAGESDPAADSAHGFLAAIAHPAAPAAKRSPCRLAAPQASSLGPPGLRRCSSAGSLSEEGYASSCSLSPASSGGESPGGDARRLPIFSRLSVADE